MAKKPMDDLLKRRMSATNQASDLQTSDTAYEKLFRETPPVTNVRICAIALDKLTAFFTADIGFKPYTPAQLEAFAGQLMEEGLMVRIMSLCKPNFHAEAKSFSICPLQRFPHLTAEVHPKSSLSANFSLKIG